MESAQRDAPVEGNQRASHLSVQNSTPHAVVDDHTVTIPDLLWISSAIILAAAVRVLFLLKSNAVIDADEAIVGLMAKHILEGKGLPVFYYGQHYMGSFEALCAAGLFSIFGISELTLKFTPLLFSLGTIFVVYLIGLQLKERFVARFAALYLALSPAPFIIWSTKARGGFLEVIFIGTLSLLYTIKWMQSDKKPIWLTSLICLLLGFGWWVNNQIIYFMVPIGLVFFAHLIRKINRPNLLIHFCAGLGAFLVGGAPFWLYNIRFDFISFYIFTSASQTDASSHLAGFIDTALPILLGSKQYWGGADLYPNATALLIGTALFIIFARVFWSGTSKPNEKLREGALLFTTYSLGICLVFSLSSFGHLYNAPRYLLPLYVGVAILIGVLLAPVFARSNTRALLCALPIFFLNASSLYPGKWSVPGEPFVFKGERVSKDHSELTAWLERHNYSHVSTNYWIGYRLTFETREKVKNILFQEPRQVRIPEYSQGNTWLDRDIPLVTVPTQGNLVALAFDRLGYKYETISLSGYEVFYNISTPPPDELQETHLLTNSDVEILPSHGDEFTDQLIDGDLSTRWRSAQPQNRDMSVRVILRKPQHLKSLTLNYGTWEHDSPQELEITVISSTNKESIELTSSEYQAICYVFGCKRSLTLPTSSAKEVREIVFRQRGSHPLFDWSIAELEMYSTKALKSLETSPR